MSNRQSIILPGYDKRVAFFGGTGSGKTYLAMTMASHYDKVFYIDPQHNLKPHKPHVLLNSLDKLKWEWAFRQEGKHILFRPKPEDVYPKAKAVQFYDKLLYMLHKRGKPKNKKTGLFDKPFIIYIDESYALGKGPHYPGYAEIIAVMDRQKGIGLWFSCQRPVNIPVSLRTECHQYFVFYLSRESDNEEIAEYGRPRKLLKEVLLSDLKLDHSFIEINRQTGQFIHHPKI